MPGMVQLVFSELENEATNARLIKGQVALAVRDRLRQVSLATERRVKHEMPVDTGRARASWGHWSGGDSSNPEASAGDAIWNENDGGMSITQGSNVEYVQYLNDGHSKQAPAGFLDAAEEQAQRVLDDEISSLMELF